METVIHFYSNVWGKVFLKKKKNKIKKCIQQGHLKLIKSDNKDFNNATKDFYFK